MWDIANSLPLWMISWWIPGSISADRSTQHMRTNMKQRLWIPIALFALLLLPACGEDSPTDTNNPPPANEGMSDALEGYWGAQDDVTESLLALNTIMANISAAIDRGPRDQEQMDVVAGYVDDYVAQSAVAAANFDALLLLEDQIVPYGDRGAFTNLVSGVCRGVYNTGKNMVVSSGQMVRTGWRVMSGSHTMREALGAPDSGIPLVSGWAQDLQRTTQRRNDYISQSIAAGDSQDGSIPYDQISGSTPEEKAQNFRNLPEDDPIKKEAHRNFLLWSPNGWQDCLTTLKDATKTGVKGYAGAVSGSEALVEVTEQLVTTNQSPEAKAIVTPVIEDKDTSVPIAGPKTMIISKRNQPEGEPKIVVLEGVDPEFELELPQGQYDIITIADEYIRSAELGLQVIADQATGFLAELMEFASNSLIIESISATPGVAAIGETVTCSANAASTIGRSLAFTWEVTGGVVNALSPSGHTCTFQPGEGAEYTVTVSVSDADRTVRSLSTTVIATPVEIDVTSFSIAAEQIVDDAFNPGEQLTLDLQIANSSDSDMTGDVFVTGAGGITVPFGTHDAVFVASGEAITRQITIQLPADYSADTGRLTFHYQTADVVIAQDLEFAVDFYVEVDPITSPVTDRILRVTGRVANPLLASAHLVIDYDYEQLYEIALVSGTFSQDVIVEASAEEEDHTITILADSGSRHAEDSQSFTSQVPPTGFRVTLTWDTGGTDVDLWVTDPFGTKCYYAHAYNSESGLGLDVDDTDGYGPENISSDTPPPGAYLVQVHYYSDHDSENAIGTSCNIVIREHEGTEDEIVRGYSGFLGDTGDVWTVTTIDVGIPARSSDEVGDSHGFINSDTLPAK